MKYILKVRISNNDDMIHGEFGAVPPSVKSNITVSTFKRKLADISENKIPKLLFTTLRILHNQSFRSWVSKVQDMSHQYVYDIDEPNLHTNDIKMIILEKLVESWCSRLWFEQIS